METFTGIFALVMGGISLWISQRLILLYLKVKKWNQVPAKILSKEVELNSKSSSTRARYGLKAEYSYRYNGVEHKGNTVFMVELIGGRALFMKSDAEKKLIALPDNPNLFVNPSDPTQAVIYCTGIAIYVLILFMGMGAVLFGISKFI